MAFWGGIWGALLPFLVFVSGVIAIALSGAPDERGFWPVLPFAGAELAFLAWCLWITSSHAEQTEVIDIDHDEVAIEHGRRRPEHRARFPRAWARIRLEPAPVRLHPSRLLLGAHGRHVHVGAFLTEDERRELAGDLTRALRAPAAGR